MSIRNERGEIFCQVLTALHGASPCSLTYAFDHLDEIRADILKSEKWQKHQETKSSLIHKLMLVNLNFGVPLAGLYPNYRLNRLNELYWSLRSEIFQNEYLNHSDPSCSEWIKSSLVRLSPRSVMLSLMRAKNTYLVPSCNNSHF